MNIHLDPITAQREYDRIQSLNQFKTNMEQFYKSCGEATVIGRGYITILDLESALRGCGMFEFKRKRKLKQAIIDVKRIISDYTEKLKD